jgi:sugar O-acyltransferase (sialic acid O-acetyltransferase NeuD family)
VIIFGAGNIAEVTYHYLTYDSSHEIVAFTVNDEYITTKEYFGLPVVPFEDIKEKYPPNDFKMIIAIGYQNINRIRAAKYKEAKSKGYSFISYINSNAYVFKNVEIGENCLILENQAIQACVKIGNNVTMLSGNLIGHHSVIGDNCWITSQVVMAGHNIIEPNCFFGVNVTIGHLITIGRENIIGAGSLVTKDTEPKSVFIAKDTKQHSMDTEEFMKTNLARGLRYEDICN